MTNEELDRLISDSAASYNEPPPVPRDRMWDAIESARFGNPVTAIGAARNRATRWLVAATGIAAVLMAGVLIGRYSRGESTLAATASSAQTGDPKAPTVVDEPQSTESGVEPSRLRIATPGRAGRDGRSRIGARDFSGDDAAYRVAVMEHLTRTEVLLTSFQSQARTRGDSRVVDAQFAALSRDLLGTTRLMLATHRNDDPTMTRLLEDLELVLMQISQYAAGGRPIDLDAATQSIDKRNVITKLRSTIPAGT